MEVKVEYTHHVPPNKNILEPMTMHDCRRLIFGFIPCVSTTRQIFLIGSKQWRSLKWRSRIPLKPPKIHSRLLKTTEEEKKKLKFNWHLKCVKFIKKHGEFVAYQLTLLRKLSWFMMRVSLSRQRRYQIYHHKTTHICIIFRVYKSSIDWLSHNDHGNNMLGFK